MAVNAQAGVRYAISGDARLAFTVFPGGPHDIVSVPAWISNQDLHERSAEHGRLSERLTSFATVVKY